MEEPFLGNSASSQKRNNNSPPWSHYFTTQSGLINPTMSNDAPSWLSGNETNGSAPPPASAPAPVENAGAAAPAQLADTSPSLIEPEEGVEKAILLMRVLNMAAAIALMTASIIKMASFPNPAQWVLAGYATCTGLLVCCLETQLKFIRTLIAMNFGFLFNPFFRFLYYVLMASIAWAFDDILGKIVAGCLMGVALYNTYVLVMYPSFRKIREQIALEEDKRLEHKISNQVKKQAIKKAKSDWASGK